MKVTKLSVAVRSTIVGTFEESVIAKMSSLRTGADEAKKAHSVLGETVKGVDTWASEIMALGLSEGLTGAEIGKAILAHEKDVLKHFEGTNRQPTMKQFFANVRRVAVSLEKVIGKTDKGAVIKGADKLKNAKGQFRPLQSVARDMPTRKAGIVKAVEIAITQEMKDYASELAGECDWDKKLASKVLALVFAEATKS